MIFFTRKLYDGLQPDSGWERRAENAWSKLSVIYEEYRKVIAPLVPKSAVDLDRNDLHDAVVDFSSMKDGELTIVLDASKALSKWRGRIVTLNFVGVKNRIRTRSLRGQWWLFSELHQAPSARFSLHVLLSDVDLQIDADDLTITLEKKER